MKGGVLGGSLAKGKLTVGDTIEITPGHIYEKKNQQVNKSYTTKITGLMTGTTPVESVQPGGSVAIMTELDPAVVKSDKLVGNVAGLPEKLPKVWYEVNMKATLLKRMVGAEEDAVVEPLRQNEPLMLNVNSSTTVGMITSLSKKGVKCALKLPICANIGDRVTISRRVGNRFRLIGYGIIQE
jgi:translation initiation factor 2 subunit 3